MRSSYLTNIVLLVIVIGLVWFTQHQSEPSQETTTLSLLKADDIQQITIEREQQPIIELGKTDTGWQIKQPFSAQANETRVKLILSLLSSTIHGQFHPMDQSSLGQFGLASPSVKIMFNDQSFALGNVEPLSKNRYVMYNNNIYLVEDTVMSMLKASADSFIENHLLVDQNKLVKLHLPVFNKERSQTTHFVDISLVDGHWQSDMSELTTDALITFADSWQHAQAMQVRYLAADQSNSTTPSIQLWQQGVSAPVELALTIKDQNILLTNPTTRLQYIFPLALQTELLPAATSP